MANGRVFRAAASLGLLYLACAMCQPRGVAALRTVGKGNARNSIGAKVHACDTD